MAYVQYTRNQPSKPPTPEERQRQEERRKEEQRKERARRTKFIVTSLLADAVIIIVVFYFFGGLIPALIIGGGVIIILGYGWWVHDAFISSSIKETIGMMIVLPLFGIGHGLFFLAKGLVIIVQTLFAIHPIVGILSIFVFYTVSVATYQAIFTTSLPTLDIPPESSIHSDLLEIENLSQVQILQNQPLETQVIIHPYVLENRLFLHVANNSTAIQIEIPQKSYANFFERVWINIGFNPNIDYSERLINKPEVIQSTLESQELLTDKNSIFVADGALQNLNYQQIFNDKIIFRSSSLNTELIANNIKTLGQSQPINPNNTAIINGIPNSPNELENVKLDSTQWKDWDGIQETWQDIIDTNNYQKQTGRTAVDVAEALQQTNNVLIVVAHSDGQTIFFPDGSSLTTSDLEKFREEIAKNKPIVALFSCETAQVKNGLIPFSQALIDLGAQAVVAPVSKIGARSTSDLLDQVLQNSVEGIPPIEAIWTAIQDTGITGLENWIGYNLELNPLKEMG